jgi:hypothetical protein
MKTTFKTPNLGLLLRGDGETLGIILIEQGEDKDISSLIEQAVAEHYTVEKAVISDELPTGHQGCLPIKNDHTITSDNFRTMVFSVDLFDGDTDEEPSEIRDIEADVITVYSSSPYKFVE